jgi:hypothetical protein
MALDSIRAMLPNENISWVTGALSRVIVSVSLGRDNRFARGLRRT